VLLLNTLKKRADFLAAAKSGVRKGTNSFNLQANPNGLDSIRIGYTVSKHVSKLAVVRNRVKRRLKAAAAQVFAEHAKPGFDYVLIGKIEAERRDFEVLKNDMIYALKKIHNSETTSS
jgi:ribonuclease P protein component